VGPRSALALDQDGGAQEAQGGTQAAGTEGPVNIAFSAPAADHGWLKAISDNAREAAERHDDVELTANDSATSSAEQADQIETLISRKPDVLVVLPFEGDALTPVALRATQAGIPVVNIDREFSEPGAYRTFIGGDNYGIGWQAGNFFADQLECRGNVVEIQGLAGISVTKQRSQGFRDALRRRCRDGIRIVASQPADFLPDRGLAVMENILQAEREIDAVYTHDDDMAEGVVAAIENANRQDEMFLTGAGGSEAAMNRIEQGGLYRATFLYNPVMSGSAINLARLIARGEGLDALIEPEVPSRIQVPATTVTRENVSQYKEFGF
jgi:ribose transport system substrate-binding protein